MSTTATQQDDEGLEVTDEELLVSGGFEGIPSEISLEQEVLTRRLDPPAPQSIERLLAGKYRVERVVGRSRIAVTVQVRHVELHQRFAVMYLHSESGVYLDAVERFLRGARLAQQLRGENVVRTLDAGRLGSGVPFVALEYPTGSSLRHVLQIAGPLAVPDAVDYALQLCLALAEAHGHGVAHGYLSTAQLYVTRRTDGAPLLKVFGFGVSEGLCPFALDEDVELDRRRSRDSGELLDAFACFAPEQLRNSAALELSADVWSVGAILHELLAGVPVFQATSAAALVATIAADAPAPITAIRSDVPAGLESLILRCLEKDKNARFPSIADLASALLAFAAPPSQGLVERIVKTQALGARPPASTPVSIVHIGSPPSVSAPNSTTPAARTVAPALPEEGPSKASIFALAVGGTLALAGAAMLGAAVTSRANAASPPLRALAAPTTPPATATGALAAKPAPSAAAPAPAVEPAASSIPAAVAVASPRPQRVWPKSAPQKPRAKPESAPAEEGGEDLFDDTK